MGSILCWGVRSFPRQTDPDLLWVGGRWCASRAPSRPSSCWPPARLYKMPPWSRSPSAGPALSCSPVRPKRLHLQVLVDNGVAADRQVGAARSSRARRRHRHARRRGSSLLRPNPRLAGFFVGEPEAGDLEAQLSVRGDAVVGPSPGGVELRRLLFISGEKL